MEWDTFENHYVNVENVHGNTIKSRYWDLKKGSDYVGTILFLHGIGNSIEICTPLVKPLLELGYRFLAVDFPGHGKTELCKDKNLYTNEGFPTFAYQFIKSIGLSTPVTLLVHSLGGIAATRLTASHPEIVNKLIMIGPGGFSKDVVFKFRLGSVPGLGRLAMTDYLLDRTVDKRTRNLPQSEYMNPEFIRLDAQYLKNTKGLAVRWLLGNEIRLFTGYPGYLNAELLKHVSTPTLLIWGMHDETIPVGDSKNALAGISNSRLVIFDDAGHRPHVSHTQEVVDYISEFIRNGKLAEEDKLGKTIHK